jgi:hypothetical protein
MAADEPWHDAVRAVAAGWTRASADDAIAHVRAAIAAGASASHAADLARAYGAGRQLALVALAGGVPRPLADEVQDADFATEAFRSRSRRRVSAARPASAPPIIWSCTRPAPPTCPRSPPRAS